MNESFLQACKIGDLELVKLCLSYGVEITRTSINLAKKNDHQKIFKMLKRKFDEESFLTPIKIKSVTKSEDIIELKHYISHYFTIIKTLGSGSSSQVFLVNPNKNGYKQIGKIPYYMVIKELCRDFNYNEVKFLKEVEKINFLGCYTYKGIYFLAMRSFSESDLYYDIINRKYNNPEKIEITKNLVKNLQYLHSLHIVHRDIKPENILVNDKLRTKFIDFGGSYHIKEKYGNNKSIEGTLNYVYPFIDVKIPTNDILLESDWWSLIITIYVLWEERALRKDDYYTEFPENSDLKMPCNLANIIRQYYSKILDNYNKKNQSNSGSDSGSNSGSDCGKYILYIFNDENSEFVFK